MSVADLGAGRGGRATGVAHHLAASGSATADSNQSMPALALGRLLMANISLA